MRQKGQALVLILIILSVSIIVMEGMDIKNRPAEKVIQDYFAKF